MPSASAFDALTPATRLFANAISPLALLFS